MLTKRLGLGGSVNFQLPGSGGLQSGEGLAVYSRAHLQPLLLNAGEVGDNDQPFHLLGCVRGGHSAALREREGESGEWGDWVSVSD